MVPTQSGLVERQIVGVVGDVRHSNLATEADPEIYVPFAQNPWSFMTLVVRAKSDPLAPVPLLRDALRSLDPHLPAGEFRRLEHLLDNSLRPMRFRTLLMSLFAFLEAVLAALGIYGVVSYSVTQRSREIGLRMALGATRAAVLAAILREGFILALMGVGLGLAAALALSRFLSSLVFGVSTTDPATLLALPVLVMLVALLASYLPARRAARTDPMVALRYE